MQGHTVRSTVKCGTLFWRVRAEDLPIPSPNFSKCYPWGCSVWWLYTWARLLRSSIEFHLQKRLFSTWSKVGRQACLCAILPASPCLAHHHRKIEACVLWDGLKIPQKSSELAQLESIVLICKVCVCGGWWVVGAFVKSCDWLHLSHMLCLDQSTVARGWVWLNSEDSM